MTARDCVLGCVGLCRVGFCEPTQAQATIGVGCGGLLLVCWVFSRAQACANFSRLPDGGESFFPYARTEKPDKPNTLNTALTKMLFLKGFLCVGFVLGWEFLCWVGSGEGEQGDD